MTDNTSTRYPRIPESSWWAIRRNLKQSVPNRIDTLYVASKLNVSEVSARSNVLTALRLMGLVDGENKPTSRALRWRDDSHYKDVCEEIMSEVYDSDLLEAFPGPVLERAGLERWFALRAGVGQSASKQMAALYSLLSAGDPSGQEGPSSKSATSLRPVTSQREIRPASAAKGRNSVKVTEVTPEPKGGIAPSPTLHLDIQIHISPEASADQIDRIFKSMAEHLYQRSAE